MSRYRKPFFLAVALNVVLAAALALLWWHWHAKQAGAESSSRMTGGTASSGPAGGKAGSGEAPNPGETPLVPVQLTTERLQSIGVKTGTVEEKSVYDEIRTVGNIEVDETRLSYIQVRFPGWIQKVFADST